MGTFINPMIESAVVAFNLILSSFKYFKDKINAM